jgi:hypothetical protein
MHLSNFGLFASAERNLIFAINDFDEVHPGPWEWHLKRLAASAAVAARFLGGDAVNGENRILENVPFIIRETHVDDVEEPGPASGHRTAPDSRIPRHLPSMGAG